MEDKDDKGHIALFEDVNELLEEVKNHDYNDYTSYHSAPKIVLAMKLAKMQERLAQGEYDNDLKTND